MSVVVTRTIQIICLLVVAFALVGLFSGDSQTFMRASAALAAAIEIFLLVTILRVIADVGEKILQSLGYTQHKKDRATP